MEMNDDTFLNYFAIECFRNVADQDYILARDAFRREFFPQFQWLALQAIEKYLKGISLFNRLKGMKFRHDIQKGVDQVIEKLDFFKINDLALENIKHFSQYGGNRYFVLPFHEFGTRLQELDFTVWEIRRYCRQLNIDFIGNRDSKTVEELEEIKASNSALVSTFHKDLKNTPHQTYIRGGLIEKILETKDHPARKSLIWNNLFFLKKRRKSVKGRSGVMGKNSPLSLKPEKIDLICEYIFIPPAEKEAFKQRLIKEGL
ncbi:TPA: hypothetical protein ACT9ME_001588 [Legionella pneumophila]